MNYLTGIALVAVFSFSSVTLAQESAPANDDIRLVALDGDVTAKIAVDPTVLDQYVGRYEDPSGAAFIVDRDGDAMAIELPRSWELPLLRLRAESTRDFFAVVSPVRVTFQTDDNGSVNGALMYPPHGQQAIPTVRVAVRHGTVTIHDVYEDAGTIKIASSN